LCWVLFFASCRISILIQWLISFLNGWNYHCLPLTAAPLSLLSQLIYFYCSLLTLSLDYCPTFSKYELEKSNLTTNNNFFYYIFSWSFCSPKNHSLKYYSDLLLLIIIVHYYFLLFYFLEGAKIWIFSIILNFSFLCSR